MVKGDSQAVISNMAKGGEVGACLAGKKVLVTGATGFVGSHLVGQLVSLGANVVAAGAGMGWRPIVRTLARRGQLQYIDLRTFWHPASLRRARQAFEGVEYIVHLAYEMPRGTTLAEKAVDDNLRNVVGTLRLICCLPDSVKKICFSSSVSVYGSRSLEPVSEGEWPQPGSVYAIGKLATEQYLQQHALEKNISLTILRYATIYGPLETDPRAIPNFIRQVLAGKPPVIRGNGEDVRDYVHVDDVVQATISALSFMIKDVKIYNVGSGKGHSTRQIAESILRLTGDELEPIFEREESSTSGVICDITAARTVLGYSPKVELEKGLRDEIEWFRRNPRFWQN